MSHVTSHILDATSGVPAAGVPVVLLTLDGAEIDRGTTDEDGRIGIGPDELDVGDYSLRFETGLYFAGRGQDSFYPVVTVAFTVSGGEHYHVPLLLSPFAYSTYRGS